MVSVFETFNLGVAESLRAHELRAVGSFDEAAQCEQQALGHFDRVLDIEPTHVGALGGKAMALVQLGQTRDAVAAFEAAIEMDPMAEFYRQLGLCYVELAEMEKAWSVTRKAIALDDSSDYRTQTAQELIGFGNHILHIAATHREAMPLEQLLAYHHWAASTYALAHESDPRNQDAKSLLRATEQAIAEL